MGGRRIDMSRLGRDGFTYIGMLIMIVVIGIATSVVAQTWKSISKIQKEKELIWCGHQFRNAIKGYYEYRKAQHGGNDGQYYPSDLKDLVSDPGRLGTYSWLRKIYIDPMTGKDNWVPVRTAGGIKGVRSASDDAPLKTEGFDVEDTSFVGKGRYSEWVFEYKPVITTTAPPGFQKAPPPGGAGGTTGGPGGTGGSTGWPTERPNGGW